MTELPTVPLNASKISSDEIFGRDRDGTYRSVRVVVNSKDKGKLIARTRLGYFARPDKASNP
jgi:hypothetical protein